MEAFTSYKLMGQDFPSLCQKLFRAERRHSFFPPSLPMTLPKTTLCTFWSDVGKGHYFFWHVALRTFLSGQLCFCVPSCRVFLILLILDHINQMTLFIADIRGNLICRRAQSVITNYQPNPRQGLELLRHSVQCLNSLGLVVFHSPAQIIKLGFPGGSEVKASA